MSKSNKSNTIVLTVAQVLSVFKFEWCNMLGLIKANANSSTLVCVNYLKNSWAWVILNYKFLDNFRNTRCEKNWSQTFIQVFLKFSFRNWCYVGHFPAARQTLFTIRFIENEINRLNNNKGIFFSSQLGGASGTLLHYFSSVNIRV